MDPQHSVEGAPLEPPVRNESMLSDDEDDEASTAIGIPPIDATPQDPSTTPPPPTTPNPRPSTTLFTNITNNITAVMEDESRRKVSHLKSGLKEVRETRKARE
ncbi:hypothetical protein HDU67_000757, partial [Dinochytrium kinnereticum]